MIDFDQVDLEYNVIQSLDQYLKEYGSRETTDLIREWIVSKTYLINNTQEDDDDYKRLSR